MTEKQGAIKVESSHFAKERHPIRSAQLLYSAPAWVLRGPIYLIALITMTSLAYSFWATKDQLVNAPLRLERESITIQSIVGGIISRIHVPEGDRVYVGTVLAEVQLPQVTSKTEMEILMARQSELEQKETTMTREYEYNVQQLELSKVNIKKDQSLLAQQLATAENNVRFYSEKLNSARAAFAATEKLFKDRIITRVEYDQAKAKVDDVEKAVRDADAEVKKARVSLGALNEEKIKNDLNQTKERYKTQIKQLQDELVTVKSQIGVSPTFVPGYSTEGKVGTYKSTVSGTVTQIHVKQGNMIGTGSPIFTVVKESSPLQGRALVQNKDIGVMKKGQRVQIKYFAYPYQEFGIPEGQIIDIATKPGGVTGQESMYVVKVALNEETIAKRDSKPKQLEIGLEGIGEIKTGEKRLIELMFSPISKFFTQVED